MKLSIEIEREVDGRFLAVIPELPGVMKYGDTEAAAVQAVKVLAFQVLADLIEHGELNPDLTAVEFARAA